MRHIPVLLDEVVKSFNEVKINTFVDTTLGGGGHARALLQCHPEIKLYLGIDQDKEALKLAKENLSEWKGKLKMVVGNFGNLEKILEQEKINSADGFLFDIGVSSMQLDEAQRGFSFSKEAFLDMRMDRDQELTAEKVVNTFSEKELEKIFWEYGEERLAGKIAKKIIEKRKEKKIKTTFDLVKIVEEVKRRRGKTHPATLVFQALRIYVNDELTNLERGLKAAIHHLSSEGRIAIISFHSLEDRIIKDLFKTEAKKSHVNIYRTKKSLSLWEILTKKPITPSYVEIKKNPRSRSAKLRIIEKRRDNE
jgi:16S rRNA (cytosine1402-N4)-methyltransferase